MSPLAAVSSGVVAGLFEQARRASLFVIPAIIASLALSVPSLCGAEGCSIFLRRGHRLLLAATTRSGLKRRLFDEKLAYTIDGDRLAQAAQQFERDGTIASEVGLTGWVGGFRRSLNLQDIRNVEERRAVAVQYGFPMPLWSDLARGSYDAEGPRPFLAVPMIYKDDLYGVIRVYTIRENAPPFSGDDEAKLLQFGASLAKVLVEEQLLEPGLEHYFRIWAARDGDELAALITDAVPKLFGVDCCSFFRCRPDRRFVLANASVSERLGHDDRGHFEQFSKDNIGRLYYTEGPPGQPGSKTGLCLSLQELVMLVRDQNGRWTTRRPASASTNTPLLDDSVPNYLQGEVPAVTCELAAGHANAIVLVPVRDVINPRRLAGVLRVVSTEREIHDDVLRELLQFATALADRLGDSTREQIQDESRRRLLEEFGALQMSGADRWEEAARIIGEALDAVAVTIFLKDESGILRGTASVLNEQQLDRRDSEQYREFTQHHACFQEVLPSICYGPGEGRTGWVAAHRKVLNLRDADAGARLTRLDITPKFAGHFAEVPSPGPFLAAPISLGGAGPVEGVVRAVRTRRSPHGAFSAAHELILSACTTMLAGVSRLWQAPAVVISYPTDSGAGLKDELARFLRAIGIEPLHLAEIVTSTPGAAFATLARRAMGGIVLATSENQNIAWELAMLQTCFGRSGRLLVLKRDQVRLPDMVDGTTCWTLNGTRGLAGVLVPLAETVSRWRSSGRAGVPPASGNNTIRLVP